MSHHHAGPSDWQTLPMPSESMRIKLSCQFDPVQASIIRQGVIPDSMDDRWFCFYEEEALTLHCHRSWTGHCIYQVRFSASSNRLNAIEAVVNKDSTQYQCSSPILESQRITQLIYKVVLEDFSDGHVDSLNLRSFSLPVTIAELTALNCSQVPKDRGVYLIRKPNEFEPEFLSQSTAGDLKGKNPSVASTVLRANWISEAHVLYIGKAGGKSGLQQRLRQYMNHGAGMPSAHWGGRYIWQLRHASMLLVQWQTTEPDDPDHFETDLIGSFKNEHGERPFANLRK
ncbi:hypothetical protein [Mucisphaera sp.]|uniref:hypothetical protein n=1 Tax=Mucisphaera sp. TaxID=2913024 RepID=UPI003D1498D6